MTDDTRDPVQIPASKRNTKKRGGFAKRPLLVDDRHAEAVGSINWYPTKNGGLRGSVAPKIRSSILQYVYKLEHGKDAGCQLTALNGDIHDVRVENIGKLVPVGPLKPFFEPGTKFGDWTILGLAKKRKGQGIMYRCRCKCGNEKDVLRGSLVSGHSKSCGCVYQFAVPVRVEEGDTFGLLTVIEEAPRRKAANGKMVRYIKCRCTCGSEGEYWLGSLRHGETTSCGCKNRIPDAEIGARFGKLVVIGEPVRQERKKKSKGHVSSAMIPCRCDCGREKLVHKHHLYRGNIKSCNQCHKEVVPLKPGQRFGRLTVLHKAENTSGGQVQYMFLCDCGNKKVIRKDHAMNGTRSCGCLREDGQANLKAGAVFGEWTVIEPAKKRHGQKYYLCLCSCGIEKEVSLSGLQGGGSRSCGCLARKKVMAKVPEPGTRFGMLIVEVFTRVDRRKGAMVKACCDCGSEKEVAVNELLAQKVVSCGCFRKEFQSLRGKETIEQLGRHRWHYVGKCGRHYMRSSWELAYAQHLDSQNIDWRYEPKTFRLGDGIRYTPDFYLVDTDEYVEVKGWEKKEFAQKAKLFRKKHKLTVVRKKQIEEITGLKGSKIPEALAEYKVEASSIPKGHRSKNAA